ncbi:MAG: PD-(D/E)XK nuclease family protein [Candidatus Shapirobacteria bacterium]
MRISRSKIEQFINCRRCFYLTVVLKVKQPSSPPYTLNSAVDKLLKSEFDILRKSGESHQLFQDYGIKAVPFNHPELEKWRFNFSGVTRVETESGIEVFGAVDDLWLMENGEIAVVDYKSTAKEGEVELTDAPWHDGYRRQIEVYQWLLRGNELKVSDTGYFVYCNGITNLARFDAKLEFKIKIIDYQGDDSWVAPTVREMAQVMSLDQIPHPGKDCEWCRYRNNASKYESIE